MRTPCRQYSLFQFLGVLLVIALLLGALLPSVGDLPASKELALPPADNLALAGVTE